MSNSHPLFNLYCSKCGTYITKSEGLDLYAKVYCSSCWEHMKQTYLQHITELSREKAELEASLEEAEYNLAESDDLALGGSGGS